MNKKESLKIAVLVKNFNKYGGAEKYAVEVTQRLAERGHSIDLYSWNADHDLVSDIRYIQVPCKLKNSGFLNLLSFGRETTRLLKSESYDAVISHDRTWGHDISVVHTFSYKTGLEKYSFIRMIDQVWLSPRAWVYLWLEKKQMAKKILVPVSAVIKKDIKKRCGRTENVSVITPGIDTEFFSPLSVLGQRDKTRAVEKISQNDLNVLFVGSEFRRKGLDILIPAVSEGMQLFVAGRGEHMKYYKKLAEKNNNSRIKFLGLQKDMLKWYAATDVVVLPSVLEAFGMSILEGMSCGLAVIAGENTGAAFLIDHGKNGFICSTTEDIADILIRLRDLNLRRKIGMCARKTALENTWEHAVDLFEALCIENKERKNKGR